MPYRNSMMTTLLKDSLGGNCRTAMVACVSGDPAQLEESLSTCRFAQAVACIANQVHVNEELDPALVIERLSTENAELRAEVRCAVEPGRTFDVAINGESSRPERVKSTLRMARWSSAVRLYSGAVAKRKALTHGSKLTKTL